jgi:hypothetical protein
MIKTIITIALGLLVLNIMAICKAAGDADREWEENIGKDNSGRERTGQGTGDKAD